MLHDGDPSTNHFGGFDQFLRGCNYIRRSFYVLLYFRGQEGHVGGLFDAFGMGNAFHGEEEEDDKTK